MASGIVEQAKCSVRARFWRLPGLSIVVPVQRAAIGFVAIAVVAIAIGCGGGGGANSLSGLPPDLVLKISMKDNIFEPKELTVPAGKVIRFDITNDGQAVHNVHILSAGPEGRDFLSELVINPGKPGKVLARFTKKGLVKFQCDFHLPDMVGLITVE